MRIAYCRKEMSRMIVMMTREIAETDEYRDWRVGDSQIKWDEIETCALTHALGEDAALVMTYLENKGR